MHTHSSEKYVSMKVSILHNACTMCLWLSGFRADAALGLEEIEFISTDIYFQVSFEINISYLVP